MTEPKQKTVFPLMHRLGNVIDAAIGLLENIIIITTFSSVMPKWTFKWTLFRLKTGRFHAMGTERNPAETNEPKQETLLKDFVNIMTAKKQFSNDTWQHWLLAVSMWVFLLASIVAIANVSFFINHLNRL